MRRHWPPPPRAALALALALALAPRRAAPCARSDGVLVLLHAAYADAHDSPASASRAYAAELRAALNGSAERVGPLFVHVAAFEAHLAQPTLDALAADARVERVEPNCRLSLNDSGVAIAGALVGAPDGAPTAAAAADAAPGTKAAAAPWHLDRIDQRAPPLDAVYASDNEAPNTVVYIFDTGVRATHVEFGGRVSAGWAYAADNYAPGGWIDDASAGCSDHGTHCAATAAGATSGIARAATVVPVAVLDCDGNGLDDTTEIADDAGLDLNGNGVLDACECLADIFPDNVVNGADLGVYLAYAGPCGEGTGNPDCIGDLTGDGLVDGADLGYLLAAWGPCN